MEIYYIVLSSIFETIKKTDLICDKEAYLKAFENGRKDYSLVAVYNKKNDCIFYYELSRNKMFYRFIGNAEVDAEQQNNIIRGLHVSVFPFTFVTKVGA